MSLTMTDYNETFISFHSVYQGESAILFLICFIANVIIRNYIIFHSFCHKNLVYWHWYKMTIILKFIMLEPNLQIFKKKRKYWHCFYTKRSNKRSKRKIVVLFLLMDFLTRVSSQNIPLCFLFIMAKWSAIVYVFLLYMINGVMILEFFKQNCWCYQCIFWYDCFVDIIWLLGYMLMIDKKVF